MFSQDVYVSRNCLQNYFQFSRKTGKAKKGKKQEEVVTKGSIKYNAQKLADKGVVLEIEGLPKTQ